MLSKDGRYYDGFPQLHYFHLYAEIISLVKWQWCKDFGCVNFAISCHWIVFQIRTHWYKLLRHVMEGKYQRNSLGYFVAWDNSHNVNCHRTCPHKYQDVLLLLYLRPWIFFVCKKISNMIQYISLHMYCYVLINFISMYHHVLADRNYLQNGSFESLVWNVLSGAFYLSGILIAHKFSPHYLWVRFYFHSIELI